MSSKPILYFVILLLLFSAVTFVQYQQEKEVQELVPENTYLLHSMYVDFDNSGRAAIFMKVQEVIVFDPEGTENDTIFFGRNKTLMATPTREMYEMLNSSGKQIIQVEFEHGMVSKTKVIGLLEQE